jgi:hypothetical protein
MEWRFIATPSIMGNEYSSAQGGVLPSQLSCAGAFLRPPQPTNQQERKQTMSKKTKTAVAEATAEPIIANGIEFTPKMIEDLTKIAESEKSAKEDKKKADNLKGTYKLFLEENEAALRGDWVRVGNLRVRLEVSRTLKIEIVD